MAGASRRARRCAGGSWHVAGRRQASRTMDFGDPLRWKEQALEVRGVGWVNGLGADVRYGLRQMRRAPVFTATVLVTLAAGIGLNTAVFSVIDAVLVRSLSYPDPERVLWVTTVDRDAGVGRLRSTFSRGRNRRRRSTASSRLTSTTTPSTPLTTLCSRESRGCPRTSGLSQMPGRCWAVCRSSGEDAVLLSYPFFVRAFHADPAVAGRAVTINGRQVTIAGVLPPGFRPQLTRPFAWNGLQERAIDAYRPLTVTPPTKAPNGATITRMVSVIGKLKAGVSVERARAGPRGGPKPHEDRQPEYASASDPEDDAAEGEDRWRCDPSAHRSSRCSRLRVSDCLRERRPSVSRARVGQARRGGDPGGDRGRPLEAGAPVLRRKRAHRGGRRRRGSRGRAVESGHHRSNPAARGPAAAGDDDRRPRARVRRG